MSSPLEQFEAIRRLMAVYAQLIDSRRLDEWGQLFTEDAVFQVWGQSWRGREAIVAAIGGMQPDWPGKHVVLTPVIDLHPPDRALVWTDLASFSSSEDGISIATIGRYHDELVEQDGRWRIERRAVVMAREALPEGVEPSPAY